MQGVEILQTEFLGNTLTDYLIALGIILIGFIVLNIVRSIVVGSIKKWAKRTSTQLDNALIRIFTGAILPIFYLGVVYLAIFNLNLHPILKQTVRSVAVLIATVIAIRLCSNVTQYLLRQYALRKDNPTLQQSFQGFMPAIRIIYWVIGLIFLLDNLGLNVSAMVASLGIGGIAIALAAQGVLQDLLSYFSILLDRPFEIGDFIIIGDFMGTVEQIGIKTTRFQSLSGEELIMSNAELTASRLRNYKRMQKRRIVFNIGVIYETSKENLEAIPQIIKTTIESIDQATFDRSHFKEYGDFSLNYETVYYVESSDYTLSMDIQQKINLALFEEFAQRGIEFAYPTNITYYKGLEVPKDVTETANNYS
ncbi:mechanosensitive ion channel family protein [Spirulina sp. CS-785/01]|uniref:mechanosensitive ion channel family protein n=1 Tax=Spirulina sp. CS-785/01 TaxID=3021716 RepID=UPI0023314EBE|nr:mechanosensitive ion channel family protein [Spirulina sp. CS-785/01]MDB9311479.1 mechanosensitive ion channel family protein [Spirulina sp. CS-785/01]